MQFWAAMFVHDSPRAVYDVGNLGKTSPPHSVTFSLEGFGALLNMLGDRSVHPSCPELQESELFGSGKTDPIATRSLLPTKNFETGWRKFKGQHTHRGNRTESL